MRKPITIGDLGTIITGKTPPTTNKNYYGDYAVFIKPTDISEQCKFTYETEEMYSKLAAEKYESSLIPKGAICVPCIGTIGTKMTMAPCDCYTNQSINSIVCNDRYDNEYVYYLIKNFLPGLKSYNLGTASGREYVSKSNFEKIELVAEQDKTIQKKIGEFLSRYDSLIENYQKQIKLLEEAAQRLYKEWFVDLHFPGHENTKIVDGVPEGWEKKKVGDFVTFYDKQRKPLSSMQRMNMEKIYPYYGAASLMDYVDNYLFDGIYLLFGEDGTVITPDNHPVLQYVWGKFWVNNHAHVLRGKDRISTEFLYVLFRNITISDVVTGVAQPKISQGRLSEKMAMLPPITLIEKWSSIAGTYFFQLRNLSSQIRLLTEARDRLLPKLMSGEIAV